MNLSFGNVWTEPLLQKSGSGYFLLFRWCIWNMACPTINPSGFWHRGRNHGDLNKYGCSRRGAVRLWNQFEGQIQTALIWDRLGKNFSDAKGTYSGGVRLNLFNHVLALFRAKFAYNSAIRYPVFMWESCKGCVWESVKNSSVCAI